MKTKVNQLIVDFKQALIENGFIGNIQIDVATRLINATDNSIYELLPEAVIQPMNAYDVQTIFKLADTEQFKSLKFAPRGGGTGTNGQSLTNHIVLDFSKHMTKYYDLDIENKTITVEPGVILSDLNRFLSRHGLFFAPNVSTADRATIGGMIATDAAGKGSLVYGKTNDHVLSLELVLVDGEIVSTEKTAVNQIDTLNNSLKDKFKQIIDWLKPVQDEIDRVFPPLKRPLSGYNIRQCYQNNEFDFTKIITGSEGTLGVVTKAKLNLLPIPKYRALVVIHYPSFLEALRAAEFLIKYNPTAIEAVDEKVQKSAQTLPNWPILAKMLNSEGKIYISNFMELNADTQEDLDQQLAVLQKDLNADNANYVTILDNNQINQLWSIRSLAVGLAGKIPGVRKPVAFVEDAIVPPQNLASFVEDLQNYLIKENLNYSMYGHVDVGCIHVRPALNLTEEEDRDLIRPITEEVIKLLNKYQGILWGEHGKGFRGEFVPDVFGPVLYPILCKIKQLFDPENRLNTGKITAPSPEIKLDRIELVSMRGEFDAVVKQSAKEQYPGAMLCNGNGACFNKEPSNVMCPSYKVTNDRVHSPKGRAMLVKQFLRETAIKGSDKELAYATYNAMKGCLGCKGCTGKCPTQVSIPDLKAKFLDKFHRKYKRRTVKEQLIANIESILPDIARFPKTWNLLNKFNLVPKMGMTKLPKFSIDKPLDKILAENDVDIYSSVGHIELFKANPMIIFADAFTSFMNHNVLLSVISVARKMGYTPYVIKPMASGKALVVEGDLKRFKRKINKLAKLINPVIIKGIPVVALENTVTLMFRDEAKKFADGFQGDILTIAEFINQNIDKLDQVNSLESKYLLLPHCTEQAIKPNEAIMWNNIFTKFGSSITIKNAGCCGMAGTYGYLKENSNRSEALYKMHWEDHITDANHQSMPVLATGFSCRSQVLEKSSEIVLHPVEILA